MPVPLCSRFFRFRPGGLAAVVVVLAIASAGLLCWPSTATASVLATGSAR